MFGLGFGELLIILVIVLLVFGAGKLPQIGDALGRSIKNFKRAAAGDNEIEVSKKKEIAAGKKSKALAEDVEEDDAEEDAEVVPAGKKRKVD
jgi:sec-independent protein translocase protein TatA